LISWFAAAALAGATDTNALFDQWLSVQTNLQSWTADFTQTRTLKVLAQPLLAPGKVWVRQGEFRWELGQPPQTVVVREPNLLLITYPQLKRVEKYSLEGVPAGPVKDALSLLDASLPRDRATMEKHFHLLSAVQTNSILQMTLQPNSASARKFVNEIVIAFRTNDFSIAATQMKFADGSTLRNDFSNVVMNQTFADTLFQMKPPPDFTVVEPMRQ
jgi:outer membrane lipoprotein-sorting protein